MLPEDFWLLLAVLSFEYHYFCIRHQLVNADNEDTQLFYTVRLGCTFYFEGFSTSYCQVKRTQI